jgi:glutamate formiminotransferase/formiminotetrahydrofolate cyclodeaminase
VGLIPKEAMLLAGRYYLDKQGKSSGVPEEELIRTAVVSLGLNDVSPFDPEKKIIEYQFQETGNSLLLLNVREFANELSMDSPAPGGGSTAALCGALSASLSSMVSNLTVGKKGYEKVQNDVKKLAVKAQSLKDEFLRAVDLDTESFNKLMETFRLPKKTEEQKEERERAVEEATKEATLVPFEVLKKSLEAMELAKEVILKGNKNSISDAGVAGLTAQTAAEGAYYNIKINLPNVKDTKFKRSTKKQAASLMEKIEKLGNEIRDLMDKELK